MRQCTALCVCVAVVAVALAATTVSATASSTTTLPDADNDGVADAHDACPKTTRGSRVDDIGCAQGQVDADFDGVCDRSRPKVAKTGKYAVTGWCVGVDNCKYVHNVDQADSNGNGRGDACDLGTWLY